MNFNKTQNEFCILAYSFILYQKKNNDFIRRLGLNYSKQRNLLCCIVPSQKKKKNCCMVRIYLFSLIKITVIVDKKVETSYQGKNKRKLKSEKKKLTIFDIF